MKTRPNLKNFFSELFQVILVFIALVVLYFMSWLEATC